METNIKPNFLIVGVARCGTTSLFKYLSQHPEVCFSTQKEPKFFSFLDLSLSLMGEGDSEVYGEMIKSEEEYYGSFKHCVGARAIGEASSDYFYFHNKTIPRIREYLGDPKIIIVLRNPYDRAYSAYSNMIRDSREDLNFLEGLKAEDGRIESNYDWMWFYRNGSMYAKGVKAFKESFTNVHVILNEDLSKDTLSTIKSCYSFLNVSTNFVPSDLTRYSHSGRPKNRVIKFISRRKGGVFMLRRVILKLIPRKYLESLAKRILRKEEIDKTTIDYMKEYFKKDIGDLEKQLGIKLSSWKHHK